MSWPPVQIGRPPSSLFCNGRAAVRSVRQGISTRSSRMRWRELKRTGSGSWDGDVGFSWIGWNSGIGFLRVWDDCGPKKLPRGARVGRIRWDHSLKRDSDGGGVIPSRDPERMEAPSKAASCIPRTSSYSWGKTGGASFTDLMDPGRQRNTSGNANGIKSAVQDECRI